MLTVGGTLLKTLTKPFLSITVLNQHILVISTIKKYYLAKILLSELNSNDARLHAETKSHNLVFQDNQLAYNATPKKKTTTPQHRVTLALQTAHT